MNTSLLEQIRGGHNLRQTTAAQANKSERSNTAYSTSSAADGDIERKSIVRILFGDGTYKIFPVTATTTVNELGLNIFKKMKYPDTEDFSMTLIDHGKTMSLSKGDVLSKLMADWDEEALKAGGSDNYKIIFNKFKVSQPVASSKPALPSSAPPPTPFSTPLVPTIIPTVLAPVQAQKDSGATPAYSYSEKKPEQKPEQKPATEEKDKAESAADRPARPAMAPRNLRITYGDKELTAMLQELGLASQFGETEDDLLADTPVDFETLSAQEKRKLLRKSTRITDEAGLDDLMSKLYSLGTNQ